MVAMTTVQMSAIMAIHAGKHKGSEKIKYQEIENAQGSKILSMSGCFQIKLVFDRILLQIHMSRLCIHYFYQNFKYQRFQRL